MPLGDVDIYAIDIERDILWPECFPNAYLQERQRYQDILDDKLADEDAHSHAHNEMIYTSRSVFSAAYEELFRKEGAFRPNDKDNKFYYSTPTIVRLHPHRADDFLIVCRLTNYRIDPVTRLYRDFLPLGTETYRRTSALALHRGIKDLQGTLLTLSDDALNPIITGWGPEDPKLLRLRRQRQSNEELMLTITSHDYSRVAGNGARMVSGTLHPDHAVFEMRHAFSSPYNRDQEKNWVAFQKPGDREARLHFVYEWFPLRIGTLVDETNHVLLFNKTIETPRSFKFLRGSTNGVAYKQEIWFLVHGAETIHYTYYHKIVVLDAETLQVKRHSYPFVLEGLQIEFCLGLDLDEKSDTMTIAYSVFDGSSVVRRIALWKIEALMVGAMNRTGKVINAI
jgi:hypothetical protein